MTNIGGFQRPHQGRRTVFQKNTGQQLPLQVFLQVKAVSQQPAHHDMGLVAGFLALTDGVTLVDAHRREHPLLITYRQLHIQTIKPLQSQLLEAFMMLVSWNVPVGRKDRIAGMVVMTVEAQQVVVAQIYNVVWLTTTVVVVGGGREQVAGQVLPQL